MKRISPKGLIISIGKLLDRNSSIGFPKINILMKALIKMIAQFFKREWFLLVVVAVIALIFFVFEYFRS